MSSPCLVVLTARGPAKIIAEGGSQAWRLNREKAKRLEHCVCVQNRENGLWGGADQEHHAAFLVGRISDVVPSPEAEGRFLVKFSEYARIYCGNSWPGLRNPVRYSTLDEFGIADPESLTWQPMPEEAPGRTPSIALPEAGGHDHDADGVVPLTMAQAKAGLALGLGVPESAIEISVKF